MNYGEVKENFKWTLNNLAVPKKVDVPDYFLGRGMARIQRDLKLPFMQSVQITLVGDNFKNLPVPTDYMGLSTLLVDGKPLNRVSVDRYFELAARNNCPSHFTLLNNAFLIASRPQNGSEIALIYYRELKRPELDTDENELTRLFPDVMMYAGLLEAARDMLFDNDIINLWTQCYVELRDQIQDIAKKDAYEGRMTMEAHEREEY